MNKTKIVLGCGNVLVSDDSIGLRIIRELAHFPLPNEVILIEAGVTGIGILDYFNGQEKAIIIDALFAGKKPGTIKCFRDGELPHEEMMPWSLHGMGIVEALKIGYKLEPSRMPKKLTIIGIQIENLTEWSQKISPEVKKAIPKATMLVLEELGVTCNA